MSLLVHNFPAVVDHTVSDASQIAILQRRTVGVDGGYTLATVGAIYLHTLQSGDATETARLFQIDLLVIDGPLQQSLPQLFDGRRLITRMLRRVVAVGDAYGFAALRD